MYIILFLYFDHIYPHHLLLTPLHFCWYLYSQLVPPTTSMPLFFLANLVWEATVAVCSWLQDLSHIRKTEFMAHLSISLFSRLNNISLCTYMIASFYTVGYLSCVHILAVGNSAATNTVLEWSIDTVTLSQADWVSVWWMPRWGIT